MQEQLFSAGEFARLARTTKRTVLWYAAKGLLEPQSVAENGYRLYEARQIIDFQVILLLRKLGFSLEDIKQYVTRQQSLEGLMAFKKQLLEQELRSLTKTLRDTETFYRNLTTTGLLVNPEVTSVPATDIYYIRKQGPYAKIGEYCHELKRQFAAIPTDAVYLTVFEEGDYLPRKAHMRIGVVATPDMRVAPNTPVTRQTLPTYKALVCRYQGSGALLSLLWQELDEYKTERQYKQATGLGFASLETYRNGSMNGVADEDELVTELHLPIG